MNKETLQQEFSNFKKQVSELRMKLQKTGEQFLAQNFKILFSKYTKLESISWSQYTPHFNDGDECVFSSKHRYADIVGSELDEDSKEYEDIKKEFEDFMAQFDNDLLRDVFGDGVKMIVTREGITVEEYNHD